MAKILIIGGNRGLGLEWTKYYLSNGDKVTATFHDKSKSNDLFALQENKKLTIRECDVTQDASVNALKKQAKNFDLIIYNAGTKGYRIPFSRVEQLTSDELKLAFEINSVGLHRVINAFFSEMANHPNSAFVYMSAGVSSAQHNASGNYPGYRESKAAGNIIIQNWDIRAIENWSKEERDLSKRPIFFTLNPGFVDVGMGLGCDGAMPVQQAIDNMVKVIKTVSKSKDTFGLYSHNGTKIDTYIEPNVIMAHKAKMGSELGTAKPIIHQMHTIKKRTKVQNTSPAKSIHRMKLRAR